jgi:uncharacterized protein
VKSLGLDHPAEVELTARGVMEDRRFYLVDGDGRLVGGVKHGTLVQVRPEWESEVSRLALTFPDGSRVEGEVGLGNDVQTDFYGKRLVRGRIVVGPWGPALSSYVSAPLTLVRVENESYAVDIAAATLVSDGSLAAVGGLDGRRFRMLLELEGCAPFEEDAWAGTIVQAGSALLRITEPVPRCAVTTQDPDTGLRDHDTLRVIRDHRGPSDDGRIFFGMYANVESPGRVAVGDTLEALP